MFSVLTFRRSTKDYRTIFCALQGRIIKGLDFLMLVACY